MVVAKFQNVRIKRRVNAFHYVSPGKASETIPCTAKLCKYSLTTKFLSGFFVFSKSKLRHYHFLVSLCSGKCKENIRYSLSSFCPSSLIYLVSQIISSLARESRVATALREVLSLRDRVKKENLGFRAHPRANALQCTRLTGRAVALRDSLSSLKFHAKLELLSHSATIDAATSIGTARSPARKP